jgi:hypothetical protein
MFTYEKQEIKDKEQIFNTRHSTRHHFGTFDGNICNSNVNVSITSWKSTVFYLFTVLNMLLSPQTLHEHFTSFVWVRSLSGQLH